MLRQLPFRGTILNTVTVIVGALVGMALGRNLSQQLNDIALAGIGLICIGLGVKLMLESKNILITGVAIIGGGILGKAIGIDVGLEHMATSLKAIVGGDSNFNQGLITASVLFCVGPMTLLGCIKDGLEHDIHLLTVKSVFDMVAACFLAAGMGSGVLVSAGVLLVVQGLITALAKPLKPLAANPQLAAEASAAGGAIIVAIAINLLKLQDIRNEVFLPALIIAPLIAPLFLKMKNPAANEPVG